MKIGELAARTALQPDTIRYYEREGLLTPPPRTPAGYRDYGPEAVLDLDFVRKAQAAGLTIKQIREVMEISVAGRQPCEHVRLAVTTRLGEVEKRLDDLETLRKRLRATLRRLERVPLPRSGCRCAAIDP